MYAYIHINPVCVGAGHLEAASRLSAPRGGLEAASRRRKPRGGLEAACAHTHMCLCERVCCEHR